MFCLDCGSLHQTAKCIHSMHPDMIIWEITSNIVLAEPDSVTMQGPLFSMSPQVNVKELGP